MTIIKPVAVATTDDELSSFPWSAAIAGALITAALGFLLDSFGAAIGLAITSTAPTWRDSSVVLQLLSGLYLLLIAMVAFGVGGYLAGRTRKPLVGTDDEIAWRDGVLGLTVWAIAVILTVVLSLLVTPSLARLGAPSSGAAGSAQSVAGENIIAYDLDRLFRAERRPQNVDLIHSRSEAARILLTTSGHSGVSGEDRTYLTRLVASVTGLPADEAQQRVDTIIQQAHDNIRKARQFAVLLAFMTGVALLAGAAVAWFAASTGGDHRDGRVTPGPLWSLSRSRPMWP